jgi:uncharacterized protein YyaL (SSP411 family)
MHSYTNRLIHETSPYLLQHAHNPVDWYSWSTEAFERAKKENKPVLVSIGYSACHWCHVMERESFEDPEVAGFMNQNFINIKVDREERPDVDHIYMDAVQAITGSGGWPLNVFITPEGKPFYGGTYFPPRRAFNRASWIEILQAVSHSYNERKEEIENQANSLTEHLQSTNVFGNDSEKFAFDMKELNLAYENIMKTADKEWGGFGKAPKFPQSFTINFLLRYSWFTGNQEALSQALLSLDKMIQGGIYDQLGGGFARYSTDAEWLAPHFEKMLYDNALLVTSLAEAYQLTKNEKYKEVVEATLDFIEKELMHKEGGFFSALDADSEGEEGKFYVWDYTEIEHLLGEDAAVFMRYFNVRKEGNWEGKNILHTSTTLDEFAQKEELAIEDVRKIIGKGREILLQERNKRIRPSLDDKLLLSWNALMNTAYSKAYAATGNDHYKDVAIKNMGFLITAFSKEKNEFFHSWKNGQAKHPAFLDDYSFLIAALIDLSEITADNQWLHKAKEITIYVIENFSDGESSQFFYTNVSQSDILLRKKEVYDSAIPSGNSVMALNLYRLSIFFDDPLWQQKAVQMVSSFGSMATKYPTSFGVWLSALFQISFGTNEIAIIGSDYLKILKRILTLYLPHSILMAAPKENDFALLKGKTFNGRTLIYLCRNYACQQPVDSVEEFENRISSNFLEKNTIFT